MKFKLTIKNFFFYKAQLHNPCCFLHCVWPFSLHIPFDAVSFVWFYSSHDRFVYFRHQMDSGADSHSEARARLVQSDRYDLSYSAWHDLEPIAVGHLCRRHKHREYGQVFSFRWVWSGGAQFALDYVRCFDCVLFGE